MNNEKDGEKAFEIHQLIQNNELTRRRLLGANVALLKQMKDEELYKAVLGDEHADWVAYLGQIEVFYSRNDIYNLTRIYDKYIVEFGMKYETIADIPKSRLVSLLSVITPENRDELLEKARVLTQRDFIDTIRELKGQPTTDTCQHEYKEYEICKHCGEKHDVNKKFDEEDK